MKKALFFLLAIMAISACGDVKTEAPAEPLGRKDTLRSSRGKLTGEDGLLVAGGPKKGEESNPLGVNSFLWRATLDTLSFMPLTSADPFGGTIITDWYEDPKTPGERFKITALILDKSLRADGIKITLFKQKFERSSWRDQRVDAALARTLEDTILTRARELKVQSK